VADSRWLIVIRHSPREEAIRYRLFAIRHLLSAIRPMLLALDTATRHISLALHDGLGLVAESSWLTAENHTVELAPNIALMLKRANLEPGQLRGLAVALGPGSYTGLRIGLGFAKGLALAHNTPLIGVPTFEILMRAQPKREGQVIAVIQAGRGRISVAEYRWLLSDWEAVGEIHITDWNALAETIGEPAYLCGEIDATGHEVLLKLKGRVTLAPPAESLRRAGWLAEIGWERLRAQRVDDPQILAPIYGGQLAGASA
jgi:tRNA threonylcarbamoyladenosine biosynthesis protein TsaB